jgi:membrane-bound lytic murein transglycosylase B
VKRWSGFLACAAAAALLLLTPMVSAAPAAGRDAAPTAEDQANFAAFLRDFRTEALAAGIKPETFNMAFAGTSINPKVQELNLVQPEFVRPIWQYLAGALSEDRVRNGRDARKANAKLLTNLRTKYGVAPEVLVAIWGMETAYGKNEGSYNIFEALATLAYQGPRAVYAKRQLLAALKIVEVEGRDPKTMYSSWAGAFGQTQFVPTTFLDHAVDGDGDGKRDVWNSHADALASTANYLKNSGWHAGFSWGEEVKLPKNFVYADADPETRKTFSEWRKLGVRDTTGKLLPESDEAAAIFLPAGYRGPAFLLRENFNVILKYNFATSYALAIGLLSDRVRGAPALKVSWPTDLAPLDESSRTSLQEGLTALGFDTGGTDGVFGRRTRGALREYQKAHGLPADGFPTSAILTHILNERASKGR